MTALLQRSRDSASMDRLFFSGRVLPGREIILNAGGDSRSPRAPLPSDDDCSPVVMEVRRERKVTIFPGGFTHSHTLCCVHTTESSTEPQVRAVDH